MKKKIDLSVISEKDLYAELDRRSKKETVSSLRGCIAKCWHCKKGANLKKWFRIDRYWFEDNVYTSNYNHDEDTMIVCPNCNRINDSRKKWRYDTLTPNKEDLNELALYQLIKKFEKNGGVFAKYYKKYDAQHYGGRDDWYEVPDRYSSPHFSGDKCNKVELNFK